MKNWDFRFNHSYRLRGHYNCVNALAFTPQGNILASGGDDKRILLWDTFSLDNKPCKSIPNKHDSHILTLAIDCKGQRIFSAGASSHILFHDLQTGEESSIEGSKVWKVRTHPTNSDIIAATFAWFSDRKGYFRLYDLRVGKHTSQIYPEHLSGRVHRVLVEGLAINPVDPNYFLVGGEDCVQLFDMRNLGSRPIKEYWLPLRRKEYTRCSDVKFLPDGSRFVACFQNYFPILYSTSGDDPAHIFYGSEYTNYATVKSLDVVDWGNSSFVIAGSDNKKIYTWMIPSNLSSPERDGTSFEWKRKSDVNIVHLPYQVISSCHRGNVSNVLFNRELNCLYASGVENAIVLHTPFTLHVEENDLDPLTKENKRFLRYFKEPNPFFALDKLQKRAKGVGKNQPAGSRAIIVDRLTNISSDSKWLINNPTRLGLTRYSNRDPFSGYPREDTDDHASSDSDPGSINAVDNRHGSANGGSSNIPINDDVRLIRSCDHQGDSKSNVADPPDNSTDDTLFNPSNPLITSDGDEDEYSQSDSDHPTVIVFGQFGPGAIVYPNYEDYYIDEDIPPIILPLISGTVRVKYEIKNTFKVSEDCTGLIALPASEDERDDVWSLEDIFFRIVQEKWKIYHAD